MKHHLTKPVLACMVVASLLQVADAQSAPEPISIEGVMRPVRVVDLAPIRQGHVSELHINEGDMVTDGAVLLRLNSTAEEATLAVLQAKHEDQSTILGGQASVAQAEARLAIAEIQLQAASQEYEVLQRLFEDNSTSERELNKARTRVLEAEANIVASEVEVTVANAELARITAEHNRLALEIIAQQLSLAQFELNAPFAGIVTRVQVEEGQAIGPNEPILRLIDNSQLEIEFYVPVAMAASLSAGINIQIEVPQATGEWYSVGAVVHFVNPEVDTATRTQRILVRIDNKQQTWLAGMPAKLEF